MTKKEIGPITLCQTHLSALKSAIEDRGLRSFVASTAVALERKLSSTGRSAFDPFYSAQYLLFSSVLYHLGSERTTQLISDSNCPLCFAQDDHDECCETEGCQFSFNRWIDKAADEMLKEAVRLGLMGES